MGSLFSFTTISPEVVERPFDLLDKLGTGRLMVLPSAMSSLRSELRVEDGPNGTTSKDTRILLGDIFLLYALLSYPDLIGVSRY